MLTCETNYLTKKLLLEDHKTILNYIREFEGGKGDEEALKKLLTEIDNSRIGTPHPIQKKIDSFIENNLIPMVYDEETVFPIFYSSGYIDTDGTKHIDSKEEINLVLEEFLEVKLEVEKKWLDFAMNNLYPLLIA